MVLGGLLAACSPANVPSGQPSAPSSQSPPAQVGATVYYFQGSFAPSVVNVRAGQAVEWVWKPPAMPANVAFSSFTSPVLQSGVFYHVFDQPGTFRYHSTLSQIAAGTVVVGK
jgi:plastocyanin